MKKVNPRILSTFPRSFPKKMGTSPSSNIIHSLGGEVLYNYPPKGEVNTPYSQMADTREKTGA